MMNQRANAAGADPLEAGAILFARLALAAVFLSAVADRFGLWGAPGGSSVAWGTFAQFLEYTAKLNPFLPATVIPALGWAVTIAEIVAATMLLAGMWLSRAATLAAVLLIGFSIGMTIGTGVKSALDASVPAAAAAAVLLAVRARQIESTRSSAPSEPAGDRAIKTSP